MLLNKSDFLAKFNIDEKIYKKSKLKWNDLEAIYNDFKDKVQQLNSVGLSISNALQVQNGVHSVRFRVKDPEHLIEKIIRKVSVEPTRIINLSNYQIEITDLVGVRAIHLFKSNWKPINDFIQSSWDLNEKPIAYIRNGDSQEVRSTFEAEEFNIKEHDIGYRSLHYIIKTKPTKVEHFVEIQVRTLFEEGWSEIDHKIRYPYNRGNDLIGNLLMIFNRLAGSADEMADYIQTLGSALSQRELEFDTRLQAREDEINELKKEINRMKLKPEQKSKILTSLEQLNRHNAIDVKMGFNFSDFVNASDLRGFLNPTNSIEASLVNSDIINANFSNLKGLGITFENPITASIPPQSSTDENMSK